MNPDGPVAMAKAAPLVSVVIPTFREAVNLPVIVPQVAGALAQRGWSVEILVADDDSRDGTEEVCRELAERWPLRLITRIGQRGLSGAVLRGLQDARGQVLVVMDADLSHPPEKVPELIDALDEEEVDFVLGSRYIGSGTRSPAVPKAGLLFGGELLIAC